MQPIPPSPSPPPATLSAAPAVAALGSPTIVTASDPFATGASIDYGDGTIATVSFGATPQTFAHVYARPGIYALTLRDGSGARATASAAVGVQTASLVALTPTALVGTNVTYSAFVTTSFGLPPTPVAIDFGDGSPPGAVSFPSARFTHTYAKPGVFTASLVAMSGQRLASAQTTVEDASARVPIGTIYSTSFTVSPVLAGDDTSIRIAYSLATPRTTFVTNRIGLQAIVDLVDASGTLVRRSDPFTIPYDAASGGGIHFASIPYSTPIDASGAYGLRVYLRSADGGTVAVGAPAKLLVLAGPDPAPNDGDQMHANGAVEVGPRAGTAGNIVNTALSTAFESVSTSLGLTGLFDPVSHRLDPLITLKSSARGPILAPDAVGASASGTPPSAPLPSGLIFTDVFGRANVALPSLLGGSSNLRGVDATYAIDKVTYHAAYGYSQLPTATTDAQRDTVFDLRRGLGGDGAVRLTFLNRQDDSASYVSAAGGPAGPQDATSSIVEYSQSIARNLKFSASGALSDSQNATHFANANSDAADRLALTYAAGRNTGSFAYDNAGPEMAVAGGPSAPSDHAGYVASAALGITPYGSLNLGWTRAETRSAFSRTTGASAQFSLAPPNLPSLSFGFNHSGQNAPGQVQSNDQYTFALNKATAGGALSFAGSIAAVRDPMQPTNDGVTRSGQFQYSIQRANGHQIGIGLNADLTQGVQNADVGESLVYSFPFGGRVGPAGDVVHGLSLQLSGSNFNVRAAGGGGQEVDLGAVLTYHLDKNHAVSVRAESRNHNDLTPGNSTHANAVRLRLDTNL